MDGVITPQLSVGRQALTFARHFVEMCLSMCIGGGVLHVAIFLGAAAVTESLDVHHRYAELFLLAAGVIYAAPMAGWMRFRGMDWPPIAEMAGATVALGATLAALGWLGVIGRSDLGWLAITFCGPACVVMFFVMLPRVHLYTGRSEGHAAHAS